MLDSVLNTSLKLEPFLLVGITHKYNMKLIFWAVEKLSINMVLFLKSKSIFSFLGFDSNVVNPIQDGERIAKRLPLPSFPYNFSKR